MGVRGKAHNKDEALLTKCEIFRITCKNMTFSNGIKIHTYIQIAEHLHTDR
jgi:hypothetical protein